jgi:hypothetical protein
MATKTFFSGLTLGAGLVYFLDPERGGLRRERSPGAWDRS